jgi:hypothetical protein
MSQFQPRKTIGWNGWHEISPSDPTPGLHTIRVRTAVDYGAPIVARANYWLTPEP